MAEQQNVNNVIEEKTPIKEEQTSISEEKAKRLIVAGTVGAVLLLVILLSVMLYQLISISVKNSQIAIYNQKIAKYEALIAEGEETKEARSMRIWIEREARRLGLKYQNDAD